MDPGRDTPFRLSAYAGITGATWELVTESPQNLAAIAKYFGFSYRRVPQDNPPAIDWLTHQPLTYDINHSDGFIFLNPRGTRSSSRRPPPTTPGSFRGSSSTSSPMRDRSPEAPSQPGWTANQGIQAVAWLLRTPLPAVGS